MALVDPPSLEVRLLLLFEHEWLHSYRAMMRSAQHAAAEVVMLLTPYRPQPEPFGYAETTATPLLFRIAVTTVKGWRFCPSDDMPAAQPKNARKHTAWNPKPKTTKRLLTVRRRR